MSESGMRQKVVRGLKELNAIAVENPVLPGTPDVNYVEGWIELKWLRSWPKNDGVVQIPHYTPQQKVWHFLRRKAGGNSWFLLQCKRDWLLLDGAVAVLVVNKCTRSELISAAHRHWDSGLDFDELKQELSFNQLRWNPTPTDIEAMR